MNYVYVLRCKDDSLYTGWTNHLAKRLEDHNAGRGAKYTRGRGPVELLYFEGFASKEQAMKREYAIKQMPKSQKMALIEIF
ncbi:MAG: GIY-YIG nuclease family protein [Lachnospiraceae bacterium]